jgi:thiol-disulfide isomerase/thioredoxin
MKNTFLTTVVLFFALVAQAQGIQFFHGTWSEAKAKAQTEGKLIFVDAYAEWCGPCKRMAATVFPDPKAGEYFNENFVCLKIDMEKEENAEFAGKFPVSAYPTLMFIDDKGAIAAKQVGALDVTGLLEFGQKASAKSDKSVELQKRFDAGERAPEFLYNYVSALNRAGKPTLKVVNDYLATQTDLTSAFNLGFIFEGTSEADSRVFDLMVQNRAAIAKMVSEKAVSDRIERACKNTVAKAIEFKDVTLLEEAKSKMKAHQPTRADEFARESDVKFTAATKDTKGYLKVMKKRQKQVGNNAARLNDLCVEMIRAFPSDPKVLKQAAKWSATAAKNGGLPDYYLTLAELYKRLGDKDKARKAVSEGQKAIGEKDAQNFGQKFEYFLNGL